jgi:hypothetical protein
MNKTQFLKKMNQLQGDERNLFILSCGLMNNSKIQSVNDIERTLGITFSKDEVVSMNKYMFTVSTICKMTGTDLFDYLSDEYCKLMI